jgi:hypothetical protein
VTESGCAFALRQRVSRRCCSSPEAAHGVGGRPARSSSRSKTRATLLLRITDGANRTLDGKATVAAGSAGELALWIDAPSPRSMGMIAGPSRRAAGIEPRTVPVTATEGSVDTSRIASVRLGIARPIAPRELVIGPFRIMAPSETERTAYEGIVDEFGQFQPGNWPEKVTSTEMLRERAAAEAGQLAGGAVQPLRDRFDGLMSIPSFGATGFFRAERRDGRWWLVTAEGHGFFSIGIDAVAPSGATYVEGREFMFRDLPARDGELAAHWSDADDRRGLGAQRGRALRSWSRLRFLYRQPRAQIRRRLAQSLARGDGGSADGLGIQHDRQLERPRFMGDASPALYRAAVARRGVCQGQLGRGLVGTDA